MADHKASGNRQAAMFGLKLGGATIDRAPPFPELLAHIWDAFREISVGIQGNGWSHPVITWEAYRAWSASTGQQLEPREARFVLQLGQRRAAILNASLGKRHAGQD